MQLGHVVSNLDEALRYWVDVMKIGPFVVLEKCRDDRTLIHRGRETLVEFSLAFAYLGEVQIELIHQINDAESPYKEFLDSGREGLHHLGFWPNDFPAACNQLETQGHVPYYAIQAADGTRSGVYYETYAHQGLSLELVPMTPLRAAYFGRIYRLAQTWDGVTRPIRRFASRADFLASNEGLAN